MRRPNHLTYFLAAILAISLTSGSICHGASASVLVSATIPSKHHCKFNGKGPVALDFGTLNPLSGANVTRTAAIDFECTGNKNITVVYAVSDDDGLNETGPNANRMKHLTLSGPNAFIPYSFSISPTSGNTPLKTPVILTITGTIFGPSYQTAYSGNYSDTVIVSIDP